MNSLVNENVINSFLNDDNFNNELKAMLNAMIDEELAKEPENMDCDLIDECVQMLIDIEQESDKGFAVFVPLLKSKAIISACEKNGFRHLSRSVRALIVAAIILLSAMTANAAVDKIFDYNIAHEVVSTISEKLKDWGIIANADDKNEITVDGVPTTIPKKETAEDEETTTEPIVEETTTELQVENVNKTYDNPQVETAEETTTQAPLDETTDTVAQKYTLTFDANGGQCDVNSIEVTYGLPIGKLPVPTKEGYDFTGWYNIDISYVQLLNYKFETKLTSSTIYKLKKDATVTAKWSAFRTIILNANGGECEIDSLQISSISETITLPTPTREGYFFRGWLDLDGNIVTDTSGLYNWISPDKGYELTAQWIKDGETDTVYFYPNGGTCDVSKKEYVLGHPYGELPVPTRSGYKFLGWYTSANINSTHITEDSIFFDFNKLYALWYQTTATVTFDANGGECDVESKTIYSHNLYGELPTPTRAGYTFDGWYYDENHIVRTTGVGNIATDHTLTAKWSPISITVNFYANGGKISSNNDVNIRKTYKYMTEFASLPDAARDGYRFLGWYTEPEGGTKIEKTDLVDYLVTTTLYAHWEEDTTICTVTLYSNNSADSVTLMTFNKGDKLGEHKPVHSDFTMSMLLKFAGWYTDKYYGEKVDSDFVITGDIDLYAHWTFNEPYLKVTLELEKTEYELNEELDLSTTKLVLNSYYLGSETVTGEALAEGGAHIDFDTSTYGYHTVTVTFSEDVLGYIVTFETSAQIFVRGCEHNTGTYIANYVEPTCTKDGYTGDALCNGCNELIKKGTTTKATGHIIGEVITKATFSKDGKIAMACTKCGEEESSTSIPKAVASLSAYSYIYDGTMKTPNVSVYPSTGSATIDYTVTMDDGRTEIGKYNVYIKMNTDYYEDEIILTFFIDPEPYIEQGDGGWL